MSYRVNRVKKQKKLSADAESNTVVASPGGNKRTLIQR